MKHASLQAPAKDVMNTRVMAVGPHALARDVALHLLSGVFSGLPVIARDRALLGVVTEFDLLKALEEGRDLDAVEAEAIMSKPPITVEEDTPIKAVIKRMTEANVLRVPVVREGKLVGVISRSDLLDHLIAKRLIVAYGTL
ncbi:MAG: CBS domain-containing protein [Nitrospirota bacterium]